jgi:tRNA pseudouridine(55) synthase
MDGVIVIDKPAGLTSHDVVARVRRALGEKRIGHTGTLDPMATGVLPLVIGRATRLASMLSGAAKTYEAGIRLRVRDRHLRCHGTRGGPRGRAARSRRSTSRRRDVTTASIEAALGRFRGSYEQTPPPFSAKKIGGRRGLQTGAAAAGRGAGPSAGPGVGTHAAGLPRWRGHRPRDRVGRVLRPIPCTGPRSGARLRRAPGQPPSNAGWPVHRGGGDPARDRCGRGTRGRGSADPDRRPAGRRAGGPAHRAGGQARGSRQCGRARRLRGTGRAAGGAVSA